MDESKYKYITKRVIDYSKLGKVLVVEVEDCITIRITCENHSITIRAYPEGGEQDRDECWFEFDDDEKIKIFENSLIGREIRDINDNSYGETGWIIINFKEGGSVDLYREITPSYYDGYITIE